MDLNNPENLFATKVSDYIRSGFSMSTISSCKSIESKDVAYRDKDRRKKFCKPLRVQAMEILKRNLQNQFNFGFNFII